MHMLYDSDNYAVVLFEVMSDVAAADGPAAPDMRTGGLPAASALGRGGYEIVDKFAGKEIYLSGVLADHFRSGVEALIESSSSEEEIDAYLERFGSLMQQPVVLH